MTCTESTLADPYTEVGHGLDIPGLHNDTVHTFKWSNISATIPAQGKKPEKGLLADISGQAEAGMSKYAIA